MALKAPTIAVYQTPATTLFLVQVHLRSRFKPSGLEIDSNIHSKFVWLAFLVFRLFLLMSCYLSGQVPGGQESYHMCTTSEVPDKSLQQLGLRGWVSPTCNAHFRLEKIYMHSRTSGDKTSSGSQPPHTKSPPSPHFHHQSVD